MDQMVAQSQAEPMDKMVAQRKFNNQHRFIEIDWTLGLLS
jgi:hypothetical protein